MKKSLIIFFLIGCISCTKDPAVFTIDNLNNGEIGCFGHGGMGSKSIYPINSIESLQSCINRGADGTELDVQVTKDSVLVIFHNEQLASGTSCSGIIRDLNWSDIDDCTMKSNLFKHLELVSFDEFIQKLPNPKDYIFTLDCKSRVGSGEDPEVYYKLFAKSLVNTVQRYDLDENVFVENPDIRFLNEIKYLNGDIKLFFLIDDFDYGLQVVKTHNFYGLSMFFMDANTEQIKTAHSQNKRVTLYGVSTDKENYAAVEKSPDYIQTDNIVYLLKIFNRYTKGKGYYYSMTK
ncbi:MAG: glycerophosphoryl diester phosphodiesterase [Bacteroidetes bacterium]|nr:glycerophosphoryl diester phosphodiesterase [Bacteroidota bacterium]